MELVSNPLWLANVLLHDNGVAIIETLKAFMELVSNPLWLANVLLHDNRVAIIETLKAPAVASETIPVTPPPDPPPA